jgi:hypothetical protein
MLTLLLVLMICLATPLAAADTTILHADFDGDTPGAPPDVMLPGPPPGDSLTLVTGGAAAVLVRNSIGTLVNQSVEMTVGDPSEQVQLHAFAAPSPGCETVRVRWRSLARSNFVLWQFLPQGKPQRSLAVLFFEPNGTLSYNNATLPLSYTVDVDCEFEILIDFAAQTTSLSVDGMPVAGSQDLPFANAAAEFEQLAVFGRAFGAPPGAVSVAIDDLTIDADCSLPVENRTWGSIKALYTDSP